MDREVFFSCFFFVDVETESINFSLNLSEEPTATRAASGFFLFFFDIIEGDRRLAVETPVIT